MTQTFQNLSRPAFHYKVLWGFDALFRILAAAALVILAAVACLPRRLPTAAAAA